MKKWNSGPPPSLGWWPASICRIENYYRWWNGEVWSIGFKEDAPECWICRHVARADFSGEKIEWKKRPKSWPKRSFT